jgi:hypothetical protein
VSRNHDARVLVFNCAAPTSDHLDIDALLFANPASWIDAAYLRQQAETPSLSCALASTTGVVARGLMHDGNPRPAAHLANAVVLERPEGAVITKVDRLDVADRNPHLAVLGPHVRAQNVALRAPETITTTIRPATASRYHTNTE